MDSRRRTILSNQQQSQSSQESAIPYPPSALKQKSRYQLPSQRLSTLPRQSLAQSSSQDNFVPSASRADAGFYGRQSLAPRMPPPSVQRSSVYGRQSVVPSASHHQLASFLPPPRHLTRDPRPMRDRNYINELKELVHKHLLECAYPFQITAKTLTSPTTKDFQSMFRFLYTDILDPAFIWAKDFQGKPRKFEEEVMMILRDLRYPVADSISKTQLQAASAQHIWPGMLAMLAWLADMNKTMQNWYTPDYCDDPQLAHPSDLNPQDISNWHEKVSYEYASSTYVAFLQNEDEFPNENAELEEIYKRQDEEILKEVEDLEKENQVLRTELEKLEQSPSPLAEATEELQKMKSDKGKFKQLIQHFEEKKSKTETIITKMQSAVEALEKELNEQEVENEKVSKQVEAQNLTPEEIDRMKSTRVQLSDTLDKHRQQMERIKKSNWDLEILSTKAADSLENVVKVYMELCERIGIVPGPPPEKYLHVQFDLDYSRAAATPSEMFSSTDIKGAIKNALIGIRKDATDKHVEVENDNIILQEQVQRVEELVVESQEKVQEISAKLETMKAQTDDEKSRMQAEVSASNSEMREAEQLLHDAQANARKGVLALDQRYQSLMFQYDNLLSTTQNSQQELSQEVVSIVTEIINLKQYVQPQTLPITSSSEVGLAGGGGAEFGGVGGFAVGGLDGVDQISSARLAAGAGELAVVKDVGAGAGAPQTSSPNPIPVAAGAGVDEADVSCGEPNDSQRSFDGLAEAAGGDTGSDKVSNNEEVGSTDGTGGAGAGTGSGSGADHISFSSVLLVSGLGAGSRLLAFCVAGLLRSKLPPDVDWKALNGSLVSLDGAGISFKLVGISAKADPLENLLEVSEYPLSLRLILLVLLSKNELNEDVLFVVVENDNELVGCTGGAENEFVSSILPAGGGAFFSVAVAFGGGASQLVVPQSSNASPSLAPVVGPQSSSSSRFLLC
ncbi:hypothetical protein E3Q02_03700 [Wallemia mellicola]|uniref:DUF5595 domain-containing protein n=1 Tax=Wallemia mellicola TaxID=1708541 RepID=A0AB38MRP9_9BASI|nr:hypothetical protein E3Q02_03700 [Wallemia mellicola]